MYCMQLADNLRSKLRRLQHNEILVRMYSSIVAIRCEMFMFNKCVCVSAK